MICLPAVLLVAVAPCASAQNAPLVSDPGQDHFEFCKQLYRQANNERDPAARVASYRRVIPRLNTYIGRFPRHRNTAAATYYLGECYYHSGAMDDGRRVLHSVVNRYRKGRYVALASNRLGYDAVSQKKYAQAAIHFGRVAANASTAQERHRGRYQQASCYRYAGETDKAIHAYSLVENANGAPSIYRENASLKLGLLYLLKKEDGKAMEKFKALMEPSVSAKLRMEATLNYGLLALKKKETETADRCFKAVLLSNEEKLPSARCRSPQRHLRRATSVCSAFTTSREPTSRCRWTLFWKFIRNCTRSTSASTRRC